MAKGTSRNRRVDDDASVRAAQRHTLTTGVPEGQPPSDRELTPTRPVRALTDDDLQRAEDRDAYAPIKGVRQRTARHRQHTARARLDAAAARDAIAVELDEAALVRDRDGVARDRALAEHDSAEERETAARISGAEIVLRAGAARRRAAERRMQSAQHLALVADDRAAAGRDREHAADQRRHARADLDALAHHVAIIETDALTGARTRAAGLIDLDHERDRCRATHAALVLAFVHVDATLNVRQIRGQEADDEVLKRLVASIHDHLRGYDVIVRFADNDLVCAMSNMTEPTARRRFTAIAAANDDAFITSFAALSSSDESTLELITRAQNARR
jgi:GGDEF domain-containing protein